MVLKQKRRPRFELFFENLSSNNKWLVATYFYRLEARISLPKKEKEAFLDDFEKALMYFCRNGLTVEAALDRLAISKLGNIYYDEPTEWYPLDDAAKIYPLSMKSNWMAIFRLSEYLNENVVPEILQIALTFTMKRFPFFATTIKEGIFWHYLDSTKCRFASQPDDNIPCSPINVSSSNAQSFRVVYYKNRISVEYFHILTDATGGAIFLNTLVGEYLRLLGACIPCDEKVLDIGAYPNPKEWSNDYYLAEPTNTASGFVDHRAIQMRGKIEKVKPSRIIHIDMDSTELKMLAKSKNVTITALMLTFMFLAGKEASNKKRANIQIQVPVNMRKHYKSETLRNFSLYCSVRIPYRKITDFDSLLPEVSKQLKENSSKQAMNRMMAMTRKMVNSLRFVPIVLKNPIAKLVFGVLGDKVFSNTLSNIAVVNVPEEMLPYIKKMDFVLGTGKTNRTSCGMVTIGNTATFSITTITKDQTFEECMLGLIQQYGLTAQVSGSDYYEY